jgi:hypothetical protein
LSAKNTKVKKVVEDVRKAVEPLILPDAAIVLTAIASDVMIGVQKRNNRPDVNDACDALQKAITLLQEIDGGLDG